MQRHIHGLYLQVLRTAVLNIRLLGEQGRAKQCAIEADHVHNIPELLQTGNPGMEQYYWDVERTNCLRQADPVLASIFKPLWDQIEESRESAKSASP